jgi:hypothetical protein
MYLHDLARYLELNDDTGQRVLDTEGPKLETSQKLDGKFGGVDGSDIGTYCTVMRGNEMYGEGKGVITSKDGPGNGNLDRPRNRKI